MRLQHSTTASEGDVTVFGNVAKVDFKFNFLDFIVLADIFLSFRAPRSAVGVFGHLEKTLRVLNFLKKL